METPKKDFTPEQEAEFIKNLERELNTQNGKIAKEDSQLENLKAKLDTVKKFQEWRMVGDRLKVMEPKRKYEADPEYLDFVKKFQVVSDFEEVMQIEFMIENVQRSRDASAAQADNLKKTLDETLAKKGE